MAGSKKKRDHKVSKGVHAQRGKPTLTERQRPASVEGGIVARFKPLGTVNHYSKGN